MDKLDKIKTLSKESKYYEDLYDIIWNDMFMYMFS